MCLEQCGGAPGVPVITALASAPCENSTSRGAPGFPVITALASAPCEIKASDRFYPHINKQQQNKIHEFDDKSNFRLLQNLLKRN